MQKRVLGISAKLMQEHQHRRDISSGNLEQSDNVWLPPSKDSIQKSSTFILKNQSDPEKFTCYTFISF